MTPPERADTDEPVSRTYYRDRYKIKQPESQDTADTHNSQFWDSYGYNLRDNYGYGSRDHDYRRDSYDDYRDSYNYPASERILGGGDPCGSYIPGYRQALADPSFALGLVVLGGLATYLLYQQYVANNIGRDLPGFNLLDGSWLDGKIELKNIEL